MGFTNTVDFQNMLNSYRLRVAGVATLPRLIKTLIDSIRLPSTIGLTPFENVIIRSALLCGETGHSLGKTQRYMRRFS